MPTTAWQEIDKVENRETDIFEVGIFEAEIGDA
jgi:hypothetical protein